MRSESQQSDALRTQQRFDWLVKNIWVVPGASVVVVYNAKQYWAQFRGDSITLFPTQEGEEIISKHISEYYDLVHQMQITHPGDKPVFKNPS